jgi:hypothetical protein
MTPSTKPLTLHIGMPKTGTTTLQTYLFAKHPELDFLGSYPHGRHQGLRDADVLEFMNELVWKNFRNPDINRSKALYQHWVEQAALANKTLLLSWESLMLNHHAIQKTRAENIRKTVGAVRIIACLRHPISLVQSAYLQTLKRDNIGSRAEKGQKHRLEPIEQWIMDGFAQNRAPKTHLEYAETLQIFAEVFGKDCIKVLLFEQLVENQEAFIRDLCDFVGINSKEGIRLTTGKRENVRWTQEQLNQLKALDHSPLRALRFRFSNKKDRARLLGIDPRNPPDSPKAKIDMSPELIEKIEETTRPGNRILQDQWGLPLEQYGYPV